MTASLLRICTADRLLHSLQQHRHFFKNHEPASAAISVVPGSAVVARQQLRQAHAQAPSARVPVQHHHKRRSNHKRSRSGSKISTFSPLPPVFDCSWRLNMASNQEFQRRSSVVETSPVATSPISAATSTTFFSPTPDASSSPTRFAQEAEDSSPRNICHKISNSGAMAPPPLPADETNEAGISTRRKHKHTRGHSTTSMSRQANRLSLTLPIALSISEPSMREILSNSEAAATPGPERAAEQPADTPNDPNDFIIAIAAQERKVLELREELSRAEADLAKLKRQWTSKEAFHQRAEARLLEQQVATPTASRAASPTRHSLDLDRKGLLIQNQNTPSTPLQSRRRVFRGVHTRALSLLSPVRKDQNFAVHDDNNGESKLPPTQEENSTITAELPRRMPSKRASWQPRTTLQPVAGYPQIVEDFKIGLRAFVEDIRQITVGEDFPVAAPPRPTPSQHDGDASQEPKGPSTSTPESNSEQPQTPKVDNKARVERPKTAKQKHFSWTPLGFEALGDNDWTNWDSPPASSKTARWSGSTVNGGGLDGVQEVPEKPNTTPIKQQSLRNRPLLPPKLDELLPSMVNRLSPSNIKRAADHLMDEWEKSLASPEDRNKENTPTRAST